MTGLGFAEFTRLANVPSRTFLIKSTNDDPPVPRADWDCDSIYV